MSNINENKGNIVDTEIFISKALRVGVLASAIAMAVGLIMLIVSGNSGYPGDTFPTSISQIFYELNLLKPYAIILTGLFILILTPVFRVGISIITFLIEKDYLYVIITSIVFIILMISLLLGKGE